MFLFKLTKKDAKCIVTTLGITMVSYTVIHFINLWINSYAVANNIVDWAGNVIKVNYMYSIYPDNPVLALFYQIIPHAYWYMYLAVAVITIYLVCIYLPDIIKIIHRKKKVSV
jgi:TRAP-type C4-dicarboxylate transport system permease small subunit